MLRVMLTVAVLVFLASPASSHGEFQWIQDNHYVSRSGVHCCGEEDCRYISDDDVEVRPYGYVLKFNGQEHVFNTWGRGLHVTQRPDKPPIICKSNYTDEVRCLFVKPMGS